MAAWNPLNTYGGVIDISDNNGAIKWSLIPEDYVLVFIKATQGSNHVDPLFKKNVEGAQDTGRLIVPYHWLDESAITTQVDNFLRTSNAVAMSPLMIDWEVDPRSNIRPPLFMMQNFGNGLKKTINRDPVAYHSMYDLVAPIVNSWPWMVPKYGPAPQGPHWLFWQDRPNLIVPGITGPVDHSMFAGTIDELKTWYGTGQLPASFTPDVPVPLINSNPTLPILQTLRLTNPSMSGSSVVKLQTLLQAKGFDVGSIDGVFGPNTSRTLIKFQTAQNLQADGICGPMTWAALLS